MATSFTVVPGVVTAGVRTLVAAGVAAAVAAGVAVGVRVEEGVLSLSVVFNRLSQMSR